MAIGDEALNQGMPAELYDIANVPSFSEAARENGIAQGAEGFAVPPRSDNGRDSVAQPAR